MAGGFPNSIGAQVLRFGLGHMSGTEKKWGSKVAFFFVAGFFYQIIESRGLNWSVAMLRLVVSLPGLLGPDARLHRLPSWIPICGGQKALQNWSWSRMWIGELWNYPRN